ncbi:MAG: hypothetical protein ACYTG2_08000 [Planctomycetota bacterium]
MSNSGAGPTVPRAARKRDAVLPILGGVALLAGAGLVLQRLAEQGLPLLQPPRPGALPGSLPSLSPSGVALALSAAFAGGLWAGALVARLAPGTRALLALALLVVVARLVPRLVGAEADPLLRLDLADLGITLLGLSWGGYFSARIAASRSARSGGPVAGGASGAGAGVLSPRGVLVVLTGWAVMLGASRIGDELSFLAASWGAGSGAPGVGSAGWSDAMIAWEQPLLVAQLVGAALACLLAGWVVARLAPAAPLRHAALLAALVALWSLLGLSATRVMHQFDARWSGWLFVAGALLWPACAVVGALLARPRQAIGNARSAPGG